MLASTTQKSMCFHHHVVKGDARFPMENRPDRPGRTTPAGTFGQAYSSAPDLHYT
jgi:hypothetical protein